MDDQSIGARVKKIRKDKGLRQDQAARILGISTTGWQKIERNESSPGAETLLQFEKFGADPGWVLTGKSQENIKPVGLREPHNPNTYSYDESQRHPEEGKPNDEQPWGLDAELLETVVMTVEDFLAARNTRLAPDKLWLAYMTCYRLLFKAREKCRLTSSSLNPKDELQDILELAIK